MSNPWKTPRKIDIHKHTVCFHDNTYNISPRRSGPKETVAARHTEFNDTKNKSIPKMNITQIRTLDSCVGMFIGF